MTATEELRATATSWFATLRDRICDRLVELEKSLTGTQHFDLPAGHFERKQWERTNDDGSSGGGGTISIMRGRVFEKVGVNISVVHGAFSEKFAKEIPGAADNGGQFWAGGISLVAHPRSPLVPAVHMNTRLVSTAKSWFGGGSDLTPMLPDAQDAADFHAAFEQCCASHAVADHPRFKKWANDYFHLPHRDEPRGIGGIFFDYLDSGDRVADFDFTRDVGETFLTVYPRLVERHMNRDWTAEQRELQLIKRGRYVEFNLLHDRGTRFGLMTGGNTEAILMSLPPEARWP